MQFKKQDDEIKRKEQKLLSKATDCIGCGRCENACPQHIEIRKLIENISK